MKGVGTMSPIGLTLTGFLAILMIVGFFGAIGQALSGHSVLTFVVSLVAGFLGAWLTVWGAARLGFPDLYVLNMDGYTFPIIWAAIGAVLLSFLVGVMTRRRWFGVRGGGVQREIVERDVVRRNPI
jgi:uncharacterized membrane protein YeaQ/YmgE (transglycosylase-associated protein family)